MKLRMSLIALLSAVSLPALATSGMTPAAGELGYSVHAMPSTTSRADVTKELEAWKRNPVSADGYREVGGEIGWIYVGPSEPGRLRADVIKELEAWQRNPVTADGYREVGGEIGAVYVGVPADSRNAANAGNPGHGSHQHHSVNAPHIHRQ